MTKQRRPRAWLVKCICIHTSCKLLQSRLTLWDPPGSMGFFLSIGFSRHEYWGGLSCPPPGDLLCPGSERSLASPSLAGGFFTTAAAKSLQSCPTLCDPIDGRPPGSPDPGILAPLEKPPIYTYIYLSVYLCVCGKLLQSCPALCYPMDCSPLGSSVQILQAKILEWVAMPSSRGSSWPRNWTWELNWIESVRFPALVGGFFITITTQEAPIYLLYIYISLSPTTLLCNHIHAGEPRNKEEKKTIFYLPLHIS